jgi:hypothetical protein
MVSPAASWWPSRFRDSHRFAERAVGRLCFSAFCVSRRITSKHRGWNGKMDIVERGAVHLNGPDRGAFRHLCGKEGELGPGGAGGHGVGDTGLASGCVTSHIPKNRRSMAARPAANVYGSVVGECLQCPTTDCPSQDQNDGGLAGSPPSLGIRASFGSGRHWHRDKLRLVRSNGEPRLGLSWRHDFEIETLHDGGSVPSLAGNPRHVIGGRDPVAEKL